MTVATHYELVRASQSNLATIAAASCQVAVALLFGSGGILVFGIPGLAHFYQQNQATFGAAYVALNAVENGFGNPAFIAFGAWAMLSCWAALSAGGPGRAASHLGLLLALLAIAASFINAEMNGAIMMDIVFSSTTQLASAIRAGHVSAKEVLETHLAQVDKHNPALNAIITMDAERAHERAREADEALARGELWGPLHGVPFTLKDCHSTAGMRTTAGFPPLADYVPQEDSTVTARLKAAGGILMGKTNVPVLLADFQTNNPIFGRTNNPWNIERTPGGSSGGAAAALASGMTPFEIGSDLAGSIRIPAHYCGVFGLKTTESRVSSAGHVPDPPGTPRSFRMMLSIGPMARSVEDLALLYRIIAGPDGRDSEVRPVPVEDVPKLELKKLRIAFAPTFPGFPVAADFRDAVVELAQQLNRSGAVVEEATLPELDFNQELSSAFELIGMATGAFQPEENKPPTTLAQYLEALHRRDQSIIAWELFFQAWDVLVCPASMVTAFPHCETGSPLQVDGQEVEYWMATAHCGVFNYTGHPAVGLPVKLDRDGLPIGIQMVGKRWDESRLLAMAKVLSEVTGEFQRPLGERFA